MTTEEDLDWSEKDEEASDRALDAVADELRDKDAPPKDPLGAHFFGRQGDVDPRTPLEPANDIEP
ncbi:MAG: hypothetical protein AAFU79_25220 [Myxococcota bacterium]